MTDHEALMWNVERDPWLNPNGAVLTILDRPVDMELFRRQVRFEVSKVPRLYQRVRSGIGHVTTPEWVVDAEFDLDYHVEEVQMPAPGTERQLLDLAARLYSEPLDRTRPLWRAVAIGGLEGGRGALWTLIHHVISDGAGQIRIAALYQQRSRDEEPRPEVDLEAIIADAASHSAPDEFSGDLGTSLLKTAGRSMEQIVRRQTDLVGRVVGEVSAWPSDPRRAIRVVSDAVGAARSTVGQLSGTKNEVEGGSPLWVDRSRHRRLEYVRVPLDDLHEAAKTLGGTVNDAFMAGLVEAGVRYHEARDASVAAFNTSFVLSTRTKGTRATNAFTPVLVQIPCDDRSFEQRISTVREAIASARSSAEHGGSIAALSGLINLLPTSVVTHTARDQAAHIDFATSNMRGAPFPLYCAGAKMTAMITMGPVAGTAANITAISYDGNFEIGLFIDPVAIADPEGYRRCVEESFADLLEAAATA